MTIDAWPTEADMAELCGCGHTLGQHQFGLDLAPCEACGCTDFHDPTSCTARARSTGPSARRCAEHVAAQKEDAWSCPQEGCDRPLSAHLVSQADGILAERALPDPP